MSKTVELERLKRENEEYKSALQTIRAVCRDGTKLEFVKLLEIYEETGVLDTRTTTLLDLRTGRKQ